MEQKGARKIELLIEAGALLHNPPLNYKTGNKNLDSFGPQNKMNK
jgi:hypothetical protein